MCRYLHFQKVLNIGAGRVAGQDFWNLPGSVQDVGFGVYAVLQVGVAHALHWHYLRRF